VTTFGYDLAGQLTTETRPCSAGLNHEYDADGNITKVVDAIVSSTPTSDYQAIYTYNEFNRGPQPGTPVSAPSPTAMTPTATR
jgi:uncharacterized protein RhaS with RHS repeats